MTDKEFYKRFLLNWDSSYSMRYVWIVELKKWAEYKKGVYNLIPNELITKMIFELMDSLKINHSMRNLNLLKKELESEYFKKFEDFDKTKNVRNFKNGLFIVNENKWITHEERPFRLSLRQFNLYISKKEKPTPYWDRVKAQYPGPMSFLEKFLHSILLGDMDNEFHVYLYGPSGSGKGTVTNVIRKMFDGLISFTPINKLGEAFGMSSLVNNSVNLDAEMEITYMPNETIARIKKIVGQDGAVEINMKGVPQFTHEFREMFFISATNQMPRMPNTDVKAWYRRVLLLPFWKTQKRDADMKKGILEEVEAIATNIMLSDYSLIFDENTDVNDWVKDMQDEWQDSAYPLRKIIKDNFERTDNINDKIPSDDIINWVERQLLEQGYGIPAQKTLAMGIKKEFHKMKITKKRRQKGGDYYFPVKTMNDELNEIITMVKVHTIEKQTKLIIVPEAENTDEDWEKY